MKNRCAWCLIDPLYIAYHDEEWGVPQYNAQKLFEFIILEGMQAGLSWFTILKKRAAMQKAFHHFNPEILAHLTDNQLAEHMHNPEIIRNRLKIASVRQNAQAFLTLCKKNNDLSYFSEWIWQFTNGKIIHNHWETHSQIPITTPESDAMAKALKKAGFNFIGSTICYAFMQATGMVNDHLISCYRHA